MRLGVPELLLLAFPVAVLASVGGVLAFWRAFGRRAKRFGYPSTREYLSAAPRSDAEKRDAADLAMKGLVWCVLGLLFSPFVLVGLLPLFYGGRKLAYGSMGLGLFDDADPSDA